MATFPHHEHLRLVNFTAFGDASFDWSPGINAIIGTNGTGKTHLLKVLYAVQYASKPGRNTGIGFLQSNLADIFQTSISEANSPVEQLIRQQSKVNASSVSGKWGGTQWNFDLIKSGADDFRSMTTSDDFPAMTRPVFVPTADLMGHTKRFTATYDRYQIDYDQTYRDLVSALLSPPLRDQSLVTDALKPLSKLLVGEVEEEGERFYLRMPYGRQPMPLVAEGLRKIATLYTLLKNGYLRPGDTLFWDEPEANLNPTLMDEIIAVLLSLARSGVQVFLTTHSYFILRELDLQATSTDGVRFFSLYPTSDGTQVETTGDFAQLDHNAIMEQADSVYDREITRATGRSRRK